MNTTRLKTGLAVLAVSGLCGLSAAQAQAPSVNAVLEMKDGSRMNVTLVGRNEGSVFYRFADSPPGASVARPVTDIQAGEFVIEVDESLSLTAARDQKWSDAANLLLAQINPSLPYLDVPENNTIEYSITAAQYLLVAARAQGRIPGGSSQEKSRQLYISAFQVLRSVGRANWSPMGDIAQLRAILCLIELGKVDDAERAFREVRKPNRGDASFGVYSLVESKLLFARGKSREALDVLMPSLLYENKDVGVFPEALMFSAQLYEDLLEIHRTRDVYYEVARLFQGTEWQNEALWRLKNIQKYKLTQEVEDVDVLQVFFGGAEDMDEVVNDYLKTKEDSKEVKE